MDNQQRNGKGLREIELFAGAGGGILGGKLLGHRIVCAVEHNAYARSVLLARQNDGTLPPFPIWDDVRTFDGREWRGFVDVVSGGFPCTDISSAGAGAGIEGEASGLWDHQRRIVGEVRPRFVRVENSPMLTSRGLGRVLGDLAAMGYDAEWGCIPAVSIGANHERDRIWIIAADSNVPQRERGCISSRIHAQYADSGDARWWKNPPKLHRMDDEVAHGLDRLKAVGNGQVPGVVKRAWEILTA